MNEGFVEVYAKSTGNKQQVPEHWLGHPVLGRDFEKTPSAKAQVAPDSDPSTDWTRKQLDEHAAALGLDTRSLASKADVVAAIQSAPDTDADTGNGNGEGESTDSEGIPPTDQTPAAGENKE